jgi:hypothetical protein
MINILQAPPGAAPYQWRKFYEWVAEQGFSPDEVRELLDNGEEPIVTWQEGLTLDKSVAYPGLPSLEGSTLDADPGVRFIGGKPA